MFYVEFFVPGDPVPKQSFRALRKGGGYIERDVRAWQASLIVASQELVPSQKGAVQAEAHVIGTESAGCALGWSAPVSWWSLVLGGSHFQG
jgi:hypothetical protein